MKKVFRKRNVILLAVLSAVILIVVIAVACRQVVRSNEVKASIEMGDLYLSELDYEQAVVSYQMALDIDAKNTEASLGLAEAYEAQQMYAYAEAVYRNMLENDDTQAEAYEKLADLYILQGKLEEAKELLEQAAVRTDSEALAGLYQDTQAGTPGANYAAGAYRERIRVELLPVKETDTIYYTLDGTDPGLESQIYDEPVILKNGVTTVKAMAVNSLGFQSAVASFEYDIQIRSVEVTLEEPAIERLIREKLEIPYNEPVYNDDIERITQIYIVGDRVLAGSSRQSVYLEEGQYTVDGGTYGVSGRGVVASLEDLRRMPFLEKVAVEYQPELDISALADCTGVRELSLVGDSLDNEDLKALQNMDHLTRLNLGWNQISDISALTGLAELTSLGVWGNRISSIQPAAELKQLTYLDFSDNRVADISPVSELENLQQLWMYHNQVADIGSVADLGELRVLMLRDNPIGNPEAVRSIYPHLNRLDVDLLQLGPDER